MSSLAATAASRSALLAELATVEQRLQAEAVEAVSAGRPILHVAREAGVSRVTLYAWIKRHAERDPEKRLAVLEARWDGLVDAIAKRDMPAPEISRHGRTISGLQAEAGRRNSQAKRLARKGLKPMEKPSETLRRHAEAQLLRLLDDKAGEDPVLGAIAAELEELETLRAEITARAEARSGIFD